MYMDKLGEPMMMKVEFLLKWENASGWMTPSCYDLTSYKKG